MNYYSINNRNHIVDFAEATLRGQPPGGSLYFPENIPDVSKLIDEMSSLSREEIAMQVIQPFVGNSIPQADLERIISDTVNFEIPLIQISPDISALELFHGPTLAFKDVGARFMSRCLRYFNRNSTRNTVVLVATSGDTGGAVVSGFSEIEGVKVVVLYPSKKVSKIQELQLTTGGKNVFALEIRGTFDDCQAIVKKAFNDPQLAKAFNLTSANSINIARWLPQQLYYFFAFQQWTYEQPPIICVPSGNFGNLCAGLLAYKSGLPAEHFIAACNANDVIPRFMVYGKYTSRNTISTLSNAMDVADPSNFIRILELFQNDLVQLQEVLTAVSISDYQTVETIKQVHKSFNYVLDPHSAVAFSALQQFMQSSYGQGYIVATAHPIKFPDVLEQTIGEEIPYPDSITSLLNKEGKSVKLPAKYEAFVDWILSADMN